ncbi:MAG TPA: hypothetical protein VJ732_08780 [Bryobacteraceae bacterium]|nr:hypothetical protein [Bryobacteraceae bacterium]
MKTFVVCLVPMMLMSAPRATSTQALSAMEIVKRSVANNNADWKAFPDYTFTERDAITKGGRRTDRTYRVYMIDGSQYHELITIQGEPLSPARAAAEKQKLQQARFQRSHESADARRKRIAKFQAARRQDHELMTEMVNAFDFKLAGQEIRNGRKCFVLQAAPKPGYQPRSRETKVLTGMRGKMWIDTQTYQWVVVHAEVFRPVAFGLFIAHVQPGTEFTLEETPVAGKLWLPSHFEMQVKANILFWSRNSSDDEHYWDYQPSSSPAAVQARNRK